MLFLSFEGVCGGCAAMCGYLSWESYLSSMVLVLGILVVLDCLSDNPICPGLLVLGILFVLRPCPGTTTQAHLHMYGHVLKVKGLCPCDLPLHDHFSCDLEYFSITFHVCLADLL